MSKGRSRQKIAFQYRHQLKNKATKPEKIVKRMLRKMGIEFKFQWIFFGKKRFVIADFYLPDFEVVLEIDGKDHYKEDALIYDKYRTDFLKNRCGILDVIRFKNAEVTDSGGEVMKKLADRFVEIGQDYYSNAFRETIS